MVIRSIPKARSAAHAGTPRTIEHMTERPDVQPDQTGATSAVGRFAWQTGGLLLGRGAAFITLIVIARQLGLTRYGTFVVLLAMLDAASIPWKPTVQQGAAAALGRGGSHRSWRGTIALWWAIGAVVLGPIAWVFESPTAAAALIIASAANALMIVHVPSRILAGAQKQIALATAANQLVRLIGIMVIVAAGSLTPSTAFAAYVAGYLVGARLMRTSATRTEGDVTLLLPEVGVEALRWVEAHGPILVVALILGLDIAGGFDLLFKLAIATTEVMAGIGIVLLPDLVKQSQPLRDVVARGIRVPTVLATMTAIAFAVTAGPLLRALTSAPLDLGQAPALLAVMLALAPWMGVSKAALIAADGASWLLPSQLATASATLVAAAVASRGLVWAAAAVGIATIGAGVVRWFGMRSVAALPEVGALVSLSLVRQDLRSLAGSRERSPE